MISDPTPFMANLSLYYYDNTWIRKTKMKDPVTNRKFGNVFRFIDDLTAINDGGNISSTTWAEKGNTLPSEASVLDLDIKISNKKFSLGLHDKRESFPFSTVRMLYLLSNATSKIFYASLGTGILKIGRTNTDFNKFISCETFISKMINQGSKLKSTERFSCKIYGKNVEVFASLLIYVKTL